MTEVATNVNTTELSKSNLNSNDLLQRLKDFYALVQSSNRLATLLENTEKHRDSVRPHIYQRVRDDYLHKKNKLDKRIREENKLLTEEYKRLYEEREALKDTWNKYSEKIEEIEFRKLVGEYTEEEIREELASLRKYIADNTSRLKSLDELLEHYKRAGIGKDLNKDMMEETPEEKTRDNRTNTMKSMTMDANNDDPQRDKIPDQFVPVDGDPGEGDIPVVNCPMVPPQVDDHSSKKNGNSYVGGYLKALEGSRKGERFPLICSNITLGSSPGTDIRLADPDVAKLHARIIYRDRKYFIENLDSLGRTYVNGIKACNNELKDGDMIRLGGIKLSVEFASTSAT